MLLIGERLPGGVSLSLGEGVAHSSCERVDGRVEDESPHDCEPRLVRGQVIVEFRCHLLERRES